MVLGAQVSWRGCHRFVRVRSEALVHLYVGEREDSLLPDSSGSPRFQVSWEEWGRSGGQVALSVIRRAGMDDGRGGGVVKWHCQVLTLGPGCLQTQE